MVGPNDIPLYLLTDSYKLSHHKLYPKAGKLVAYGTFRQSYKKDELDKRIVYFGIRYLLETYLSQPFTPADLTKSEGFSTTHNAGFTNYPFPSELFELARAKCGNKFPIRIKSLKEGTVVYPNCPLFILEAEEEFSSLVTYFETLLTLVWYPSTVATLSRRIRTIIEEYFVETVDDELHFLIDSRLHDFGFRACTSVEQAIIGGSAHLLNFEGTDTLPAAYYAQYNWNQGKPVASSIPATEHSVMMAHITENEAIRTLLENYGNGICACVMDSYDYEKALSLKLPQVLDKVKLGESGFLVLRPDSGDPVQTVLEALKAGEKIFGTTTNSKGYKILNKCGVIQGDGIDVDTLKLILEAVKLNQFAASNVAFGMGGGLLQKLNRDTMSFATKINAIQIDGSWRDLMKCPKTDLTKNSLPGQVKVIKDHSTQLPTVYPYDTEAQGEDLMEIIYDGYDPNFTYKFTPFDQVKKKLNEEWAAKPKVHDPIHTTLKMKINQAIENLRK